MNMVSYERLWKTMEKKGISQYRLINHYKISAGQIGRMKKNMHVSTHTLEVFCNILQCPVEDIVEVILDPQEPDGKEPSSAGGRAAGRTAAGARDAKKAEGVTRDKAPGKPESRSGVQGTGKTAAVTGDKPAGKAEAHAGGKTDGKLPPGSREGNK
jgi:DNA-binding Xre family transcriptional regulator